MFDNIFYDVVMRGGGGLATKTAADIATSMVTALLSPITAQLDPLRAGEITRSNRIGAEYGERLSNKADTVNKLIVGYPSHAFVIDIDEAKQLFDSVREPNEAEEQLGEQLFALLREPSSSPFATCLSKRERETQDELDRQPEGGNEHEKVAAEQTDDRPDTAADAGSNGKSEAPPEGNADTDNPAPEVSAGRRKSEDDRLSVEPVKN
jgi:hypothetical protein